MGVDPQLSFCQSAVGHRIEVLDLDEQAPLIVSYDLQLAVQNLYRKLAKLKSIHNAEMFR